MQTTSWIAWRYLKSRKAGRLGSLIMLVSIFGIAVSVASLISILSVMRGFNAELEKRLRGFGSQITLVKDGGESLSEGLIRELLAPYKAKTIVPYVQGEVIAKSKVGRDVAAIGARVRGIDLFNSPVLAELNFVYPDTTENLAETVKKGAVIGRDISTTLLVHPAYDDKLELIAPLSELGPTGELVPTRLTFNVRAIFATGVYDYDAKYIFLPRESASKLLGLQAEEGYFVDLENAVDAEAALLAVEKKLPTGWRVTGWHEENSKLFAALKLERIAMTCVLVMAIIIASFSVASVVMLIVSSKKKDIAILETIGLSASKIKAVFWLNAIYMGFIGSLAGLLLGVFACAALEKWPLRLPSSYYLEILPVDLNLTYAFLLSLVGVLVALVASAWPVSEAMKTDVASALRYE